MSVTDHRSYIESMPKVFTAADLAAMPDVVPSGSVNYELDNGRLIMMSPTGSPHGRIQYKLAKILGEQGEDRGFGEVRTETGVVLWRDPDCVYGPDVSFVARQSLPVRETPEGYLDTKPELVVEIRSKNDSAPYITRKVQDYLTAGVAIVWIVDPAKETLTVHRGNEVPLVLTGNLPLDLESIIPGFSLTPAQLFGK